MAIDWPDADLTVDDLANLPDDGLRYELREGNLLIGSPAVVWHSRIGRELTQALLDSSRVAYQEVGVKFGPRDSRTPDITVFPGPIDENRAFFWPEELEIVIEMVSPSSEQDDRVDKSAKYAAAGIPEFWRVERSDAGEPVIIKYKLARLTDGSSVYVQGEITSLGGIKR